MRRSDPLIALVAILALVATAVTTQAQGLAPELLAQAEANFNKANASSNGKLSPGEFKAFIDLNAGAKIGRAAQIKSNSAYDRAFTAVDANKDGFVTWDEYVAAQSH